MTRSPSTGRVTSEYGPRALQVPGVGPFHYGEDTTGEGNVAPADGEIVFAAYSGVFGNIILVRERANPVVVWNIAHHAHLNGRHRGQHVSEGEFLAPMGATGLATGPHAHTERRVGGRDAIQSGSHTNPRHHYNAPSPAGDKGRPLENQEDEMSAEAERMIRELHQELLPGKAGEKTQGKVNKVITDTYVAIKNVQEMVGPIRRGGKRISLRQEVADAKTFLLELLGRPAAEVSVEVDAEDIADALAPLLAANQSAVVEAIKQLPADTVAAIKAAL
ncbi:M23 family metallopeptidase [Microbacterium arborescens]|uniref:M23 family metallopeptidase n=1 Tax=Microbacterium arborescens TaxID=33883 RepID=UPI000DF8448E|nr:M23 family metallopeptidase [Microbacterium arborescens]